jgi:hypothetical protein
MPSRGEGRTAVPITDEVTRRQRERDRQPSSSPRTEEKPVRNSDTLESQSSTDSDSGLEQDPYYQPDEDINFEGSER